MTLPGRRSGPPFESFATGPTIDSDHWFLIGEKGHALVILLNQCDAKFPRGQNKVLPGPSLYSAMEYARTVLRNEGCSQYLDVPE